VVYEIAVDILLLTEAIPTALHSEFTEVSGEEQSHWHVIQSCRHGQC
jgi:hypothetical protein